MRVKVVLQRSLEGDRANLTQLVKYCRLISLAYLKKKVRAGNSYITNLHTSLDDLAMDCIAELFERDKNGAYVQLEQYFCDTKISVHSESSIKIMLRRLIFSKVNDGLYRNMGIFDMSLSKIIRNLKLAAEKQSVSIVRLEGDNVLVFALSDIDNSVKPFMPAEFVELKLATRMHLSMLMPDILEVLRDIFSDQDIYRKTYSLIQIAQIIRRVSVHLNDAPNTHIQVENRIIAHEKLSGILNESLMLCSQCFQKSYVDAGKIEKETLDKYVACIESILTHHYVKDSETGDSYFDHFQLQFPDVTKEVYREIHRQYLEYMVKQVRSDLFYKVKQVI